MFEIPENKFAYTIEEATFFLKSSKSKTSRPFPVKRIASWVGKLQSLRLAIGQHYIRLSNESKFELQWWFDNLQFYTKYPMLLSWLMLRYHLTHQVLVIFLSL